MLLALLRLVVGLLGGALGGPPGALAVLWFDTDRIISGAPPPPGMFRLSWDAALLSSAGEGVRRGGPPGAIKPPGGADVGPPGGGGVPVREAERGGGGVAVLAGVFSAPGFLLIQRLSSGSYTKLLASPSLAFTGLLAWSSDSFLLPPPNQPPKPQPFLAAFASAARFASDLLVPYHDKCHSL